MKFHRHSSRARTSPNISFQFGAFPLLFVAHLNRVGSTLLPHISFLHRSSLLPSVGQQYMSQPLRHISPLIHSNPTASQLRSTLCFSITVQVHADHCFSSTLRNQSSTFRSITFNKTPHKSRKKRTPLPTIHYLESSKI